MARTEQRLNTVQDALQSLEERIPPSVETLFTAIAKEHQKIESVIRQMSLNALEKKQLGDAYDAATTAIHQMSEPFKQQLLRGTTP